MLDRVVKSEPLVARSALANKSPVAPGRKADSSGTTSQSNRQPVAMSPNKSIKDLAIGRITLLYLASVSLAGLGCQRSASDSVAEELGRLQGRWVFASDDGTINLQIEKDRCRFTAEEKLKSLFIPGGFEGTIKLDPAKSPAHFDIVAANGTTLGIYKLDGDQLTLVLSMEERARPPSFGKSMWGVDRVYERAK